MLALKLLLLSLALLSQADTDTEQRKDDPMRFRHILMNQAGDGGGGGGVPPVGGADQQLINTINSAVTSQLDRKLNAAIEKLPLQQLISQGIANALPSALEGVTTKLTETLGAQIAKLAPGGGEAGQQQDHSKGKKAAAAGADNDALIKVQTQLDELNAKLADKDRQLVAQAAEQADAKMLEGARAAFAKAGVKEPMIDAVIALHKTRGTFKSDKDGPHVVVSRKSSHGAYNDRLDLEKYATEWVESEEGKHYVPAAGAARQRVGGARDMLAGGQVARPGAPRQQPGQQQTRNPQDGHAQDVEIGEALIGFIDG